MSTDEYRCSRPEGCVCGGDLPAIREHCSHFGGVISPPPAEPVSLAAHRARTARDARLWTPRDALLDMIRRIDSGEISPEKIAIHWMQTDSDGNTDNLHCVAGLGFADHVLMLDIAHHMAIERWRVT